MCERHCQKLDESIMSSGFLESFDYVLTDCDGVLWQGEDAVPGSPEVIQAFVSRGKEIIYVTNNSTKNRPEYLKKCERLGFPAKIDNFFPTSYCAAIYLRSLGFKKKVYVFGSKGIVNELELVGIESLPVGPDILPENWINYALNLKLNPEVGAVVVGFDEHISYPKLIKAASYLKNPECLFVATNRDEQFPTDNNLIIPGTGTFVAAVETVSNRKAIVLGKPSKFMFHCIKEVHRDLDTNRCIMIGDRLNTDIALGTSNNMKTLLVLTGVSNLEEVRQCEQSDNSEDHLLVPDYYLPKLGDLLPLLKP